MAGAALIVWGYTSRFLPALDHFENALLSATVSLTLIVAIVWAMLPLTRMGRRLPWITPVAFAVSVILVQLELVPLANVCKVVGAAAVGLWLATELQRVSWVVIIAAVVSLVDVLSVAFGPTKEILEAGPRVIGYFTIAFAWLGYPLEEVHSAIGVSDIVFFSLYLGCAAGFGLRVGASALAMALSFLLTFAIALAWRVLPALPLLSVAFLAANIDLLRRDDVWERHSGSLDAGGGEAPAAPGEPAARGAQVGPASPAGADEAPGATGAPTSLVPAGEASPAPAAADRTPAAGSRGAAGDPSPE